MFSEISYYFFFLKKNWRRRGRISVNVIMQCDLMDVDLKSPELFL